LNAGATVALYSTPEQLARQTAETIAAYRAGKPIPAKQVPRYFTVNVNATVARSLGVEIATSTVLEETLHSMKE
jgi:putative ABC transport system substrate-binding protein